jgi:hypothetical protein
MRNRTVRIGNGTQPIALDPREIGLVVNNGLRIVEARCYTAIRFSIRVIPLIWSDCLAVHADAWLGVDRVQGDVLPSEPPR